MSEMGNTEKSGVAPVFLLFSQLKLFLMTYPSSYLYIAAGLAKVDKQLHGKDESGLPVNAEGDQDGGGEVVPQGPDHHHQLAGQVVCLPLKTRFHFCSTQTSVQVESSVYVLDCLVE